MNNSRAGPYLNRSFSNGSNSSASSSMFRRESFNSEKPSFSSLFTGNSNSNNNNNIQKSNFETFTMDSSSPSSDDDGVFLQISNLDQWYDETNMRNYLMAQLKPITPILSLSIETPSIAKIKVPSIQVSQKSSKHFPSPPSLNFTLLVCQTGGFTLAPQEDGTQAHFRVIYERQNISGMFSTAQQSRRTLERCSIAPAANVKVP